MQHQCGCYTIAEQCATKCDWPHAALVVCCDTVNTGVKLRVQPVLTFQVGVVT